MSVKFLQVDEEHAGRRLDNFLVSVSGRLPATLVHKIIRKGEVRVNGKRAVSGQRLVPGDVVRVPPVHDRLVEAGLTSTAPRVPERIRRLICSSVLSEEDDLIVLNKPAGIAVHGGSGLSGGIISYLRASRPDLRFAELVHRLDRDTSGCLLIAKKRSALRYLHEQMRAGRIHKVYQVLVRGRWPEHIQKVDLPLQRNVLRSGERVVVVSPEGKPSLTRFGILENLPGFTLLRATLVTGRTHQIRVHAQSTGFPVAGDEKYDLPEKTAGCGDTEKHHMRFKRLMLHSSHISLVLPSGRKASFDAPLPGAFQQTLAKIRALNENN